MISLPACLQRSCRLTRPRCLTITAGLLLSLPAFTASAEANYQLPLDHPYTLRNAGPPALESEMARQIRSPAPMSFIFPRPCFSGVDSSRVCGEPHGFTYLEAAQKRQLSVSPRFAYEYRKTGEDVNAFEGGILATGRSGPLSFHLDARMFTELHEDVDHPSFDREFVERQDEKASGGSAYSSYSRYRSNINLDLDWARISAGRDAVHWGPGLFTNLSFNQNAIPFNQISWLSHLGPVSVITLYGQLSIHGDSMGTFNQSSDKRSLYAHRYEWRAMRNLLLGISEQLVLYNQEEPFAFVPVIPLFILKGTGVERRNNGNISMDIAYRLGGYANLYSEFFIDDIQSPATLFDDNWGNKWAWMFGAHVVHAIPRGQAGLILEYCRVEPWVYTHYRAGTAQTAHGGHPLGNPLGPNSQGMILKPYWNGAEGLYLSARTDLIWKGRDKGSSLQDDMSEGHPVGKAFIRDIDEPRFRITPLAGYTWRSFHLESSANLGWNPDFSFRIHWRH